MTPSGAFVLLQRALCNRSAGYHRVGKRKGEGGQWGEKKEKKTTKKEIFQIYI